MLRTRPSGTLKTSRLRVAQIPTIFSDLDIFSEPGKKSRNPRKFLGLDALGTFSSKINPFSITR